MKWYALISNTHTHTHKFSPLHQVQWLKLLRLNSVCDAIKLVMFQLVFIGNDHRDDVEQPLLTWLFLFLHLVIVLFAPTSKHRRFFSVFFVVFYQWYDFQRFKIWIGTNNNERIEFIRKFDVALHRPSVVKMHRNQMPSMLWTLTAFLSHIFSRHWQFFTNFRLSPRIPILLHIRCSFISLQSNFLIWLQLNSHFSSIFSPHFIHIFLIVLAFTSNYTFHRS